MKLAAPTITMEINGQPQTVAVGCSVAAALAQAGFLATRRSSSGTPRAAFCGMGQCQECRVCIDGLPDRLACMTPVAEGMRVECQP
ncbi:(2Fe-2S)-binding protein [Paucibacter sp. APW11]|uniref:(2Fe-2S)-binding protein n=1 Tax=Roseateles aquae TaxID=3077235 RepID=A0ABU3PCF3_9BURK|nr:(2Fe-2S)-binding protein [Paucibacter sp. APW11]MDT8999833.1 (2Fe-2S)-binding protein [Paucibacter sp. APW11]